MRAISLSLNFKPQLCKIELKKKKQKNTLGKEEVDSYHVRSHLCHSGRMRAQKKQTEL